MEDKKVRKKGEILETLADVVTEGDKSFTKSMYNCSGSLIANKFQSEDNPASYVGWLRTDAGDLMRLEAEPRTHEGGKVTLAMKGVTVPRGVGESIGLEESSFRPTVTEGRDSQSDFFNQ